MFKDHWFFFDLIDIRTSHQDSKVVSDLPISLLSAVIIRICLVSIFRSSLIIPLFLINQSLLVTHRMYQSFTCNSIYITVSTMLFQRYVEAKKSSKVSFPSLLLCRRVGGNHANSTEERKKKVCVFFKFECERYTKTSLNLSF